MLTPKKQLDVQSSSSASAFLHGNLATGGISFDYIKSRKKALYDPVKLISPTNKPAYMRIKFPFPSGWSVQYNDNDNTRRVYTSADSNDGILEFEGVTELEILSSTAGTTIVHNRTVRVCSEWLGAANTLAALPVLRSDGNAARLHDYARLAKADGPNPAGTYQISAITPTVVWSLRWEEPEAVAVNSVVLTDDIASATAGENMFYRVVDQATTAKTLTYSAGRTAQAIGIDGQPAAGTAGTPSARFIMSGKAYRHTIVFDLSKLDAGQSVQIGLESDELSGAKVTYGYDKTGVSTTVQSSPLSFVELTQISAIVNVADQTMTVMFDSFVKNGTSKIRLNTSNDQLDPLVFVYERTVLPSTRVVDIPILNANIKSDQWNNTDLGLGDLTRASLMGSYLMMEASATDSDNRFWSRYELPLKADRQVHGSVVNNTAWKTRVRVRSVTPTVLDVATNFGPSGGNLLLKTIRYHPA